MRRDVFADQDIVEPLVAIGLSQTFCLHREANHLAQVIGQAGPIAEDSTCAGDDFRRKLVQDGFSKLACDPSSMMRTTFDPRRVRFEEEMQALGLFEGKRIPLKKDVTTIA